jgi:transcription initiation factor TFIIB
MNNKLIIKLYPMLKSTIVSGPKCLSCGDKKMITDETTGELFCGRCGFVVSDKISKTGAEWRSFANDDIDRTRVGAGTSLTMYDMGLSTIIGKTNQDYAGKPLGYEMRQSLKRMRLWDSRSQTRTSAERNLRTALYQMDKLKDKLTLTDTVVEKAAYIYRKAMERKLVRGRSIQSMVAACLYASCRNTETPRTLDDVANGINIKRKYVARCYRLIFRELGLEMPIVDPVKRISRIASIAGLSEKSKRKAVAILEHAKTIGMVAGKDPMGIAAAALYLACITSGEVKSQKDISQLILKPSNTS